MLHKRRKSYYNRHSSNLMPTLFVLVIAMVAALAGALYWDNQQAEAEAAEQAALSQPVIEEEITLPDPEADGVVAVTEESEEKPAESSEEQPAEDADKDAEEKEEEKDAESEEPSEKQPQEIKAVTSTAGSTVAECAEVDASYFADAAFVGDSLTQGLQLYDILDTNVIANRGINLESIYKADKIRVAEGYTSVFAELERIQPAKIYIQLGMNDIAWRTEKDFTRLYGELIDKVHNEFPEAELYIQSIFPVTNWYALEDNGINNEKVVTFNQHLLELCVEKGCHYLDVHSALMDENGILKGYMIDKLNGRRMGMEATGSSRRESYKYAPTSRMTNTFIDAGKSTASEIISNTEFGLYAKQMGGGSVEPATGVFNFAVLEGYIIRNGKICEPVRGATLIGKGSEVLLNIDMVGNNLKRAQGMCGSISGSIPADVGQPMIRVQNMTVGGRGE